MDKKVFAAALAACMAALAVPAHGRQLEARVRQTAGGPQIFVDGSPVPPRMFWGRKGGRPALIDPTGRTWTKMSLPFRSDAGTARATFHLRFNPVDGSRALFRNFRMLENGRPVATAFDACCDSPAAFTNAWKVWPPKHDYKWTATNGVFAVDLHPWRLPGGNPGFHFYSHFLTLRSGAEYAIEFEAKGENGCRVVVPSVYDVSPTGRHQSIAAESADTLLSTTAKAAAAGVDFVSYGIPEIWKEDGDDFAAFDKLTDSLIRVNPKVRLIPRVSVNAPVWWLRKNPDHRMQFASEHVGNKDGRNSAWGHGLRPDMAAVSSRLYRRAAVDYITRFCRHMMEKYPDNFAGVHPTGQNTHEWFYLDSWIKMNGYDPQTLAAFRAYVHDPQAQVPSMSERFADAKTRQLLDPATQTRCLQFNRFQQLEMTDFVAELARACRAATDSKKLVVIFYGYSYEFSSHNFGPANSGHYGVENLIRKSDGAIDVLCSPISYYDRLWCGSAPNMSCGESIMRRGILWLNEDDSRTHLDHRAEKTVQEGACVDVRQSQQVLLRNTAEEAVRGFGSWWMDLPGWGWYDSTELWDVQKALMPLEERICRRAQAYRTDVALVLDEESMLHALPWSGKVNRHLVGEARRHLNRAGLSHGQYLLFDVLEKPLEARLQIFNADSNLSDADVAALVAQKASSPAWRVWCWAAGAQHEDGREDLARMGRLTGFAIKRHDLSRDSRVMGKATPIGLAQGLAKDKWYGTGDRIELAYTVADAKPEEVWAAYPNGDPAIVVRPGANGGGDVFLAVPSLHPELVHAFARTAGAHTWLPREDVEKASVWATTGAFGQPNGGVGMVQAMTDATIRLRLPAAAAVYDALTNERVCTGEVVPLTMKQGDVRVLRWQED